MESETFASLPVREMYDLSAEELMNLPPEQWDALKDDMLKRVKQKRRGRKTATEGEQE